MKTRQFRRLATGIAFAAVAGASQAAPYPSQPIRLVVPFAAGGLTDVLARQLSKTLQGALKQPVVVDNKPGAGGIIGAEIVAKARADGYTLLVTTTAHVVNPAVAKSLPYNTEKDFAPIAKLASTPTVLAVNPSVPANNLKELLAFARQSGGVTYGSSGPGGITHLSGELLAARTGAPFVHVPYKGTALAVNDLLGGQINASFVDALTATKFVESGKLRAIGVTTASRSAALPNVPTLAEQGVPGYDTEIWIGFYAPGGTPPEVLGRLNQLAVASMTEPAFRATLQQQGTTAGTMGLAEFQAYVASEIAKWRIVVQTAHIQPQ
ncbi:tripartite tricarboxylate transporter substrate binding protein [Cupriavidus basilensis]|uniref:Tripartite tricarboxylate transporter substrate binding protein n=1 Tax=Cupriavidus basilensis TaxID=68895 RepID=A0ABT6ANM0_9BURK|nr:tripartite tricarboxylate transporter substrate binding protein [Cupriavidus basilensis]MDF3834214.1 tripartite tricarboxylate transporter substrate binding protein [Cupriavidus basilensis]